MFVYTRTPITRQAGTHTGANANRAQNAPLVSVVSECHKLGRQHRRTAPTTSTLPLQQGDGRPAPRLLASGGDCVYVVYDVGGGL